MIPVTDRIRQSMVSLHMARALETLDQTLNPAHAVSVASWPSSIQGTGLGGWPVRIERGKTEGTTTPPASRPRPSPSP